MTRVLLAIFLIAGLHDVASAQLRPDQQASFINSCTFHCGQNQEIADKRECQPICLCVLNEANEFMSPADYEFVDRHGLQQPEHPMVVRFRQVSAFCHRRIR